MGFLDETVGRLYPAGAIGRDRHNDDRKLCAPVMVDAHLASGDRLHSVDRHRAVGAFVIGIVVLGEDASLPRLLAAGLIISGLALMKLSSA